MTGSCICTGVEAAVEAAEPAEAVVVVVMEVVVVVVEMAGARMSLVGAAERWP